MAEEYTCIECENLYDDTDGDTDERMCDKCLDIIYDESLERKSEERVKSVKRKEKELNDGEPTTADEHNNKWLKENK